MKVYITDATPLRDENFFNEAYQRMPKERQVKVDSFRFQKDKMLSLAAGFLLQQALKEAGVKASEIAYAREGKPYLKNCVGENRSAKHISCVHFNLSHSGSMAMCVIDNHPVGCDIEELAEPPLEVCEHVFSEDEQKALFLLSGEGLKRRFFKLWTGKESYLKMTGEGLRGHLSDFSITLPYSTQTIYGRKVTFLDVPCDKNYQATVCASGEHQKDVAVFHLNLAQMH